MNPYRSGRAWLPAAVLSGVFAVTLIVLQLIFRFGYDDSYSPLSIDDSILEWMFVNNLGFWGPGAFETDATRVIVSNVAAAVVLLLATFVVAWFALRGAAPGSSLFSAFLGSWAATMVAAPVAAVTLVLVRFYDQLDDAPLGPSLNGAVATSVFGLKWGWVAALIATFVWLAVRPRPGIPTGSAAPAAVHDPSTTPPPTTTTSTTTKHPDPPA